MLPAILYFSSLSLLSSLIPQGLPFPDQEFHAIDVVIRYAITRLGFEFNNIIILAWSIG